MSGAVLYWWDFNRNTQQISDTHSCCRTMCFDCLMTCSRSVSLKAKQNDQSHTKTPRRAEITQAKKEKRYLANTRIPLAIVHSKNSAPNSRVRHLEQRLPLVAAGPGEAAALAQPQHRRHRVRHRVVHVLEVHLAQQLVQRVLQHVVVVRLLVRNVLLLQRHESREVRLTC